MLGKKIKTYLDTNGIKYAHVAGKAQIPASTFSAMLNGRRSIRAEEYFNICTALGVDKDRFAGD